MSFSSMMVLALASAVALLVLLYYAPIKSSILGFSFSPRLMMMWLVPITDIVVTLYLIGGGWFGLTKTTGIMMTMSTTATCLGLSGCALIVRKFLGPRWRLQYQQIRRTR